MGTVIEIAIVVGLAAWGVAALRSLRRRRGGCGCGCAGCRKQHEKTD